MFNEKLFKEICSARCSFENLQEFCVNIDQKEFDLENSFEKYYSFSSIANVIKKYQKKEITAPYLAFWMSAYNCIVMASVWAQTKTSKKPKDVLFNHVLYQISDNLDTLSFFDEKSKGYFDLNRYIKIFEFYDTLYRDVDNLKVYNWEIKDRCDEDYLLFLVINDTEKYYANFTNIVMDEVPLDAPENVLAFEECNHLVDVLNKNNFKKIEQ